MIAVGIDPGTNTGFAVWDCAGQQFLTLETLGFWDAYYRCLTLDKDHRMFAVIEDPGRHNTIYARNRDKGNVRVQMNIAAKVGANCREAELLIAGLRRASIPVRTVTPKKKKWNAKTFKTITGYQGRTNQHVRDAGRLVVGLTALPEKQFQRLKNKELADAY